MFPHEETSFFAAINLPLLDFNSRTAPQAGFDTGMHGVGSMITLKYYLLLSNLIEEDIIKKQLVLVVLSGCLDLMYVADLKSRKEGLEFLEAIGKGKHLELTKCLLEKVVALIIEPLSPGTLLFPLTVQGIIPKRRGSKCSPGVTSFAGRATRFWHHAHVSDILL